MEADWRRPTSLLCVYGFFSTVKPIEPFLIPYLTGPDKNLTAEQVNNLIFPVWTYSYLCVLLPVFLLTDWLRYKPVLLLQSVCLFTTTAMLLWLRSVPHMQVMQFFYGVVTASEVAYFSYIYSVVDVRWYRKASSYSRSVQLLGYTAGSVLGQLLVSLGLMSYNSIMLLTLVLIAIAFVAACLLPMPQRSMFFHHRHNEQEAVTEGAEGQSDGTEEEREKASDGGGSKVEGLEVSAERCSRVFLRLWSFFRQCYSSRRLLYWSLWWTLATCGFNQTVNYVQVLWEHVEPSHNFTTYNGGVEAASSLLGAAAAYGVGCTEVRWEQWGELAVAGFSALGAAALFLMTFISNIWACYAAYILFKCLYMLLITIAMYQIAVDLSTEGYALVFGANTIGALVLQTVITSVVVDSRGLGLDIVPQFTIYASYFSLIAVLFLSRGLFRFRRERDKETTASLRSPPADCVNSSSDIITHTHAHQ